MSGTTATYLAGIATMTINGDAWDVVGDLEWEPSGLQLETLSGQTRVEGPKAMPKPGRISATLRDRANAYVTPFQGMTNATVMVIQANGKTITGTFMWCVEFGGVKTADGTFSIKFEGAQVTEF